MNTAGHRHTELAKVPVPTRVTPGNETGSENVFSASDNEQSGVPSDQLDLLPAP